MEEILLAHMPGKYRVDDTCIHCDLCHEIAPEHFTQSANREGIVLRQPGNPEEENLCHSAKENCPVGAIHDDGLANQVKA